MAWTTRGRIVVPDGQAPWLGTHAALPAVLDVVDGHRVYFSSRDAANRSHIGYASMPRLAPEAPVAFSRAPVLSPGALGAFDDAGVTMSCVVAHGGRHCLYYTGWALGVRVPFYLHAGLAVSDDGGETFTRVSSAPLLDRIDVDPYLNASPWVLVDNGVWRMWYVSGTGWIDTPSGPQHRYHIKYAESRDGLRWTRTGHVCLDYAGADEYAFGRPCVVKDADVYRMWCCVRGDRYRLGYAESPDGLVWTRHDDRAGLDPSADGWDSEMIAYPLVHDVGARRVLLYNGNGYGRTGIGLADLA
ncbi:MAG: hypothetical protein U0P30_01305 [Vicinamibacterales bacterium]